ncbi:DUF58 domain-containing protein [Pseudokineococcus sp. 1T1Z-3]|uniref:DUF58 domain-containing protein n=1 Tax=Pseudokineococcus sp. 1T1Z-3 TaxID=3132745 RepID=UPI00309E0C6D
MGDDGSAPGRTSAPSLPPEPTAGRHGGTDRRRRTGEHGAGRRGRLRRAWGLAWRSGPGALTARGGVLLVLGAVVVALGVGLSHRDVLRLGVLLLVLPLLGWLVVRLRPPSLLVERTLSPPHVAVGESVAVRLDLHGRGRGSGTLLAEDVLPRRLRASPRFVVPRLAAGASASVRYSLRAETRGRHHLGPLRLVARDPLGLVALERATTATDPLLVVPATHPLPRLRVRGAAAGSAVADPGAGEDDVVPREYRPGDDRRRVHWRTSARAGELMVRRDERPRRAGGSVLLDLDAGQVLDGDDAVGRHVFELAVTAAASGAERLAADGVAVRLLTGAPQDVVRAGRRGRADRLERLALLDPRVREEDGAGADRADRSPGWQEVLRLLGRSREDVVVAVVGPRAGSALAAATARARPARAVALVVTRGDERGEPADRALAELVAAGWGAADLAPGRPEAGAMADAWARAVAATTPRRPVGAAGQPSTGRADDRAGSKGAGPGRPGPGRRDIGRTDPGRTDPGRAGPGRTGVGTPA